MGLLSRETDLPVSQPWTTADFGVLDEDQWKHEPQILQLVASDRSVCDTCLVKPVKIYYENEETTQR